MTVSVRTRISVLHRRRESGPHGGARRHEDLQLAEAVSLPADQAGGCRLVLRPADPTQLQGTKLLSKEFKEYGLMDNIAEFIEERAAKQPYVWQNRKLP